MTCPNDLEPAVRDQRKLRRTAWVLVGIMVAGAALILFAYEKMAREQSKDTRPAFIHEIRRGRELPVTLQDGSRADTTDLRGKVWAVHAAALGQTETGTRSLAVMKRLAARFAANEDFRLVTLVIDPPSAGELVGMLGEAAAVHGMVLPQWWLAANEGPTLHKFVKDELKAPVLPHQKDDSWHFDTSIVLIDRNAKLRRAVVPQQRGGRPYVATFDFDEAASWDARGVKTGTDLTNEQQLEALLAKTIETLLEEPSSAKR